MHCLPFCSPITFKLPFEACMYAKGLVRPDVDTLAGLPQFIVYAMGTVFAMDTGFVSLSKEYLDRLI